MDGILICNYIPDQSTCIFFLVIGHLFVQFLLIKKRNEIRSSDRTEILNKKTMISYKMFNFMDSIYLNQGFFYLQRYWVHSLFTEKATSHVVSIERLFTNHLGTRNRLIEIWD